jgi:hypothetical protein
MGIDRRNFLQQAGLTALAWGLRKESNLFLPRPWRHQINQHAEVLASGSGRKLALLVGINQYGGNGLKGCITDVEQQQELLRYRFGFPPENIVTLTDRAATRDEIVNAFRNHLIAQAQPDDIIVFHFSGYGTQAKIPASFQQESTTAINCLVPSDGPPASRGFSESHLLLETTLAALARSLPTEKVTLVLDTSYLPIDQPLQGNFRVRSLNRTAASSLSEKDFEFAETLKKELNQRDLSLDNLINQAQTLNGVVITATGPQQIATETDWGGFEAGIFTHTLTHSLWEAISASNIQISLTRSAQSIERLLGPQQQPRLFGKDQGQTIVPYYAFSDLFGAEAVITSLEKDNTAQLRLGGIPPSVLNEYRVNSIFSLPSQYSDDTPKQVQLTTHNGLNARARFLQGSKGVQVGQGLQEQIRVIPRNPGLIIALEANLGRIERVDATSAFSNVGEVSTVITAGEGFADYVFSTGQSLQGNPPLKNVVENAYGLFSVGGIPIPNTVGTQTEAVKSAVMRIVPKLQTLLAAKLCRFTVNEGSSQLGLRATLETVSPQGEVTPVISQESFRYRQGREFFFDQQSLPYALAGAFPQITAGTQIQYRLQNLSERDIYCLLLGIDSGANPFCFYFPDSSAVADPSQNMQPLQNLKLAPKETRVIPKTEASYDWQVPGPAGLSEVYVLGSSQPFTATLSLLSQMPQPTGEGERIIDLPKALQVMQTVQDDLQVASNVSSDIIGSDNSVYALNVNCWATLSFVYQVA